VRVSVSAATAPALRLLDLPGPLSTHASRLVIPCLSLTRKTPSSTGEAQLMISVSMKFSRVFSVVNLDIPCLPWILFSLRFQNSMVVLELESLKDLQVTTEDKTKNITPFQSSGVLDVHLESTPACYHSAREALFSGESVNMRLDIKPICDFNN
jgi:hypothetical protein